MHTGIVYFVGSGPGHPGLITLQGVACLNRADAVLYDYLANSQLLRHAPESAELICLGRHGRSKIWSQDAIHEELIRRARSGQTVVRLKGGDPTMFGRAAEEVGAVVEAGLPFEIVPGVTSASAASAFAGVFLTDRERASAVALVTGHEQLGKPESTVDYQSLANFPGTLVVYMGVQTASDWTQALLKAGKPPNTPVLAVRRASWPDQQDYSTTLAELGQLVADLCLRPPVVFIVGPAAQRLPGLRWFDELPLRGRTVMVTRPRTQADALLERFTELGAHAVAQPAIEIAALEDFRQLDDVIRRCDDFHFLVFCSANGVHFFMQRLREIGLDLRQLARTQLAVTGPQTAKVLAQYHLHADVQPGSYRAESLAAALAPQAMGRRYLLIRANRGRDVLAEQLRAAGAEVEQVAVYRSLDVQDLAPNVRELVNAGRVDWVLVSSSAIARSVYNLLGDAVHNVRMASISPITSQTLRQLGVEPAVEATEYTTEGMVSAILQAEAGEGTDVD